MKKRGQVISFILVLTMVLSSFSVSFAGSELPEVKTATSSVFSDVNSHWAKSAIYKWSENGVINGYQGSFRPNDTISRGEMAVILDNMMDYQIAAKNTFHDLKQDKFYTDPVLKAVAAGIIKGNGSSVRPADKISREEAAVMLGRAFAIQESERGITFNDASSIASWSKGYVAAMTEKGYLKGANNSFNPQNPITRAEIVTIIDNVVKAYYTKTGTYTDNVDGTAIIKTKDVTLKGVAISGNLIIAEGVGQGDANLDSVTVKGNTVVRGGGENSIHISGKSNITNIKIQKIGDKIRVEIADGTTVSEVEIAAGEEIVITGTVGTLQIAAADATVYANAAEIKNAEISGENSKVVVGAQSVVENVSVATTAKNTSIETEKGAVVKAVTASAEVKVSGTGTVTNVTLNKGADGSSISTPNTTIKVDKEVSGATAANNTPINAGETVTTGSDGKAAGSIDGGGSSHHGSSSPSINKAALTAAISSANAGKTGTAVSTSGSNVTPESQWVTQGAMNAYTAAIAAAQAVADKASATQAEADAAVTALAAATTTFNSAKAAGTIALTYGKKTGTASGGYSYVTIKGLKPYVYQPTGAGSDTLSDFTNVKGMATSFGEINDIFIAINSGVFYNSTNQKYCFNYKEPDGVIISSGVVLKSTESIDHTMCDILVIDEDGNVGWADYYANADDLVAGKGSYYDIHGKTVTGKKIVSAVTGFVPILVDGESLYDPTDIKLNGYDNYVGHYASGAIRTVFGVKDDGSYGILCNGADSSTNWTVSQAAIAAKDEGFVFAFNLDGGGSSEVVLSTDSAVYTPNDFVAQRFNTPPWGPRTLPTYIVFTTDNEAPDSATPVSISVSSSAVTYVKGITLADLVKDLKVTETLTNALGKGSTRILYSKQVIDGSKTITHTLIGGAKTVEGCTEKAIGVSPNGTLYYTKNTSDINASLNANSNTYQDQKYYDYSTGYTIATDDDLTTTGVKNIDISYVPGEGLSPLTCSLQITLVDALADKNALNQAITDANTSMEAVTISAIGTEIYAIDQWVTQTEMDAFTNAIASAQAIAADDLATQGQVDSAETDLITATTTFGDAIKHGDKIFVTGDDRATIKNLAFVAKTSLAAVTVSAVGTDVDPSTLWVTQAAFDALDSAVKSAEGVAYNDDSTLGELSDALGDLNTAVDAFDDACKPGTAGQGGINKTILSLAVALGYPFDIRLKLAG